jgi:hypothetical protein
LRFLHFLSVGAAEFVIDSRPSFAPAKLVLSPHPAAPQHLKVFSGFERHQLPLR